MNPVAGIGGRLALKGSDGAETLTAARARGAVPEAPRRAGEALVRLAELVRPLEVFAYAHEMGEDEARACGFAPVVLGRVEPGRTTRDDTRAAAAELLERGVDLILFAGGDGTAVDIHAAVGDRLPCLGVPAGVKMHSAVFAINPRSAGELAARHLAGKTAGVRAAEVVDVDEEAVRAGVVSIRLFGHLTVPAERRLVQGLKTRSAPGGSALAGIAAFMLERVPDDRYLVVGPGTTAGAILDRLGLPHTLLGVDVVRAGRLVAADVDEARLLELLEDGPATIVVAPVGGQGFVLGRGNQQLSSAVLRKAGADNLVVVATPEKLAALAGRPLLVDTGDPHLDEELAGPRRVVTGYREEVVYRVAA